MHPFARYQAVVGPGHQRRYRRAGHRRFLQGAPDVGPAEGQSGKRLARRDRRRHHRIADLPGGPHILAGRTHLQVCQRGTSTVGGLPASLVDTEGATWQVTEGLPGERRRRFSQAGAPGNTNLFLVRLELVSPRHGTLFQRRRLAGRSSLDARQPRCQRPPALSLDRRPVQGAAGFQIQGAPLRTCREAPPAQVIDGLKLSELGVETAGPTDGTKANRPAQARQGQRLANSEIPALN